MGSRANSTTEGPKQGSQALQGDYQAGAVWKGGKRGCKGEIRVKRGGGGEMRGNYRGLSRAPRGADVTSMRSESVRL